MTLDRLLLWRHGETDYNAAGRIQGHLDSSLTETGQEQARRAAPVIAAFQPDVALSSDLNRARSTAAEFTEVSGMPVRLDKRLRETHLGEWQGLSGAEVEHGWPGAMSTWRSTPTWAPPGGESRVEVAERALEVVDELDLTYTGTALLCAHGGLITALTARLLSWPVELWPGLGGVANCHWVVLARRSSSDHRWRLMTYNGGVAG
ncbi:glucosyl-3-phosphoglycerate phosphatase (pgm family) [Saccharopolyspora erythraea NRRL 2338]|uniref:Histidine phosphatase family protein n=2 Tax=Saccharopolyspora erythraea TaxID=1836 RepID=A0ABN1C0I7_SACER|nr:histidine phosphatase family protein [Saccharopolyspora erythraea]EQD87316.1 histidine phosphatase [Saccharopolyspora erythraea D]PFG94542.1 glucosyl-3-phosphoglycerate phosphatase (pgm family) [Saccharopolyspora erythraea NRRL 2338]QRK91290.1 histidine phosphatase family protein [Saccharopolyspora erythraea]CAM00755.1 probable phosphoglycerate mutase (phosphoglyceromutase) [Saccharopolyspora erythraea NRRL 2338]